MSPAWPLTVYYDASCPLCREEMHALVASDRHARIRLVDASAPDFGDADAAAASLAPAELMRIIHARDAAGRWHRGVDVFALAYAAVGLESIARAWGSRWARPLLAWAYPWVARYRQPLSRLRLNRPYGWLVRAAAARAARRAGACRDGVCRVGP